MLDREQIAPQQIRPLRRSEYDRMVDMGLFDEDERIELLRGALVTLSPQKPPHAGTTGKVADLLMQALGIRALVRCQLPLAATDDSEPEPDIAVVPRREYDDAHPTWAHLIVEVAWHSARKDRGVKASVYAEAGIPEYWVVDLHDDAVVRFTAPEGGSYTNQQRIERGQRLRLVEFADVELAVEDILPRVPLRDGEADE